MATIEQNIERLREAKTNIVTSIKNKGVTDSKLTNDTSISDIASYIDKIPTESSFIENKLNFTVLSASTYASTKEYVYTTTKNITNVRIFGYNQTFYSASTFNNNDFYTTIDGVKAVCFSSTTDNQVIEKRKVTLTGNTYQWLSIPKMSAEINETSFSTHKSVTLKVFYNSGTVPSGWVLWFPVIIYFTPEDGVSDYDIFLVRACFHTGSEIGPVTQQSSGSTGDGVFSNDSNNLTEGEDETN